MIKDDLEQIRTVQDLTEVFESIASIKISKIRDSVIYSKALFADLWQTYRGLRIDPKEQLDRPHRAKKNQHVFVAVTSEGKLSGGAVERVMGAVKDELKKHETVDLIVLGMQGAVQFEQQGIPVFASYHLPESDNQFSVTGIVDVLQEYDHITVFYQTYESLRVQRVASIELISTVRELGNESDLTNDTEIVSSQTYVFEPGMASIADYLETLMMGMALTQIIMESKLAQYASRFNAMSAAKKHAKDIYGEYDRLFHHAKRNEGDERLKETIKTLRRRTA